MENEPVQREQQFRHGRPLGQRLVVEVDTAKSTFASGLIIPETAKERPQFGTVLRKGTEVSKEIEEGDRIMFGKQAGIPMVIQDITYFVMHERDIWMVMDEPDDLQRIEKLLII